MATWVVAGPLLACQQVEGDRITGKDLAGANPAFSALDPELAVAFTPLAGVRRVLNAAELGRRYGITALEPVGELCFERFGEPLTPEKILPVLTRALQLDTARIEILDYSRYAVPRGTLEFTRTGLSPAGLWRGRVGYGAGRSAPVWAKVRVTTGQTWVESSKPLPAGRLISADDLVLRTGPRFPFGPAPLSAVELAAGRVPLHQIPAATPVFASMLAAPAEVARGDKVSVEIVSGAARLSFETAAESSGRTGDSILVRNPATGRLFPARIEARGKVRVKL